MLGALGPLREKITMEQQFSRYIRPGDQWPSHAVQPKHPSPRVWSAGALAGGAGGAGATVATVPATVTALQPRQLLL